MSSFFVTENTHVPIVFSGDYNDWYRNVMVGYVGDMVKWESTNKISERLNFGERKVHNITNNLSQKKKHN